MKPNSAVKWEPVKHNEIMIGDVIKWRDNANTYVGQVLNDHPLKVKTRVIHKNSVIGEVIKFGRAAVGGKRPIIRCVNARELAQKSRDDERAKLRESGAYEINDKAIRTVDIESFSASLDRKIVTP